MTQELEQRLRDEIAVLPDGTGVMLNGRWRGWLFRRHPDGQWTSVRRLDLVDPYMALPSYLKDRRK